MFQRYPVFAAACIATVLSATGAAAQERRPNLEQVGAVGVESGPPHLEFGDITGLSIDDTGNIYIVDRLNYRLSVFTAAGQFIDAAGRNGSGPGEFLRPGPPTFHRSVVYVADPPNGRMTRWVLQNGKLVHQGQSPLPMSFSLYPCGMDGHSYFYYYRNNGLIQKLNLETMAVTSFGSPMYEAPGLNPAFMGGRIACDERNGAVYVSSDMSVLRRYDSSTGKLVWEADIPGVVPPRVEVDARDGLPQYRRPSAGWVEMTIVSLVPAPDGSLLVQFGRRTPRMKPPGHTNTDIIDVRTVVYNAATGHVLEVRTDLPRIDFALGDRVYSRATDPFPQLRIFQWR